LLGAPSDFDVLLKNYIAILSLNSKIHDYLQSYIKQRFDYSPEEFSAAKFLQNTIVPGIIAHDFNDDVVRFDEALKLANSWKTAQFIETKGLGHSMHDDNLYKAIIDFIEA